MSRLLESMGVVIERNDTTLTVDASVITSREAPYEHVKKMRASIYVLGRWLADSAKPRLAAGGCAWGPRPVNLHIEGLRKLGAQIDLDGGYILAKAKRLPARAFFSTCPAWAPRAIFSWRLRGQGIDDHRERSHGAEITSLADFLVSMGQRSRHRDRLPRGRRSG